MPLPPALFADIGSPIPRRPGGPSEPPREDGPVFNAPREVIGVVLATTLVFLAMHYGGEAVFSWLFEHLALFPIRFTAEGGPSHDWIATILSPIGYAFLHADWMHLIVNMGLLLGFGTALARRSGALGFLFLYVISILAGAALYIGLSPDAQVPAIGASGGVSGVMGAICQMGFAQMRGGPLAPSPFHRRGMAMTYSLSFFLINLVFAIFSDQFGIAWQAHAGGFLAGFLLASRLDHRQVLARRKPDEGDDQTDQNHDA